MSRYKGWLIALAIGLAPRFAAAQTATMQGVVTDESSAVLPGATVTATELNTGVQTVAVTEVDGRYRLDHAGEPARGLGGADGGVQGHHLVIDLGRDFVAEFDGKGGVAAG